MIHVKLSLLLLAACGGSIAFDPPDAHPESLDASTLGQASSDAWLLPPPSPAPTAPKGCETAWYCLHSPERVYVKCSGTVLPCSSPTWEAHCGDAGVCQ